MKVLIQLLYSSKSKKVQVLIRTEVKMCVFFYIISRKYRYLSINGGSKSKKSSGKDILKYRYLENRPKYVDKVFVLRYFPPLFATHADEATRNLVTSHQTNSV